MTELLGWSSFRLEAMHTQPGQRSAPRGYEAVGTEEAESPSLGIFQADDIKNFHLLMRNWSQRRVGWWEVADCATRSQRRGGIFQRAARAAAGAVHRHAAAGGAERCAAWPGLWHILQPWRGVATSRRAALQEARGSPSPGPSARSPPEKQRCPQLPSHPRS